MCKLANLMNLFHVVSDKRGDSGMLRIGGPEDRSASRRYQRGDQGKQNLCARRRHNVVARGRGIGFRSGHDKGVELDRLRQTSKQFRRELRERDKGEG